ncbi:hypothetical protein JCM5350_002585 [Sporobolomyces pararoseus]
MNISLADICFVDMYPQEYVSNLTAAKLFENSEMKDIRNFFLIHSLQGLVARFAFHNLKVTKEGAVFVHQQVLVNNNHVAYAARFRKYLPKIKAQLNAVFNLARKCMNSDGTMSINKLSTHWKAVDSEINIYRLEIEEEVETAHRKHDSRSYQGGIEDLMGVRNGVTFSCMKCHQTRPRDGVPIVKIVNGETVLLGSKMDCITCKSRHVHWECQDIKYRSLSFDEIRGEGLKKQRKGHKADVKEARSKLQDRFKMADAQASAASSFKSSSSSYASPKPLQDSTKSSSSSNSLRPSTKSSSSSKPFSSTKASSSSSPKPLQHSIKFSPSSKPPQRSTKAPSSPKPLSPKKSSSSSSFSSSSLTIKDTNQIATNKRKNENDAVLAENVATVPRKKKKVEVMVLDDSD